ncbi:MAG: hypothetical protein JNL28_11390 [Planctomycetes bacterium]|nr:hypothetical protein [Planctomycetota bacterium]
MREFALRSAALVLVALVMGSIATACPTCRDALAVADARWAHGFSVSVLFLLIALGLIVGTFAFAVWRAVRTHGAA